MSVDKNHSEELKNYLEGKMSHEEAQSFEQKALDDPFLQDAIDGAEALGVEGFLEDVESLNSSIQGRVPVERFPMWKMAAVVLLLIVGGYSVWFLLDEKDQDPLAAKEVIEMDTVEARTEVARVDDLVADEEEVPEKKTTEVIPKIVEAKPAVAMASSGAGIALKEELETIPVDDSRGAGFAETLGEDFFSEEAFAEEVLSEPTVVEDLDVALAVAALATPDEIEEDDQEEVVDAEMQKAKKANVSRSRSFINADASDLASGSFIKNDSDQITGTVTDENGDGLAGVSVIVKESTYGVSTDKVGNFSITASENDILLFNSIGMIPQEVSIGARSSLDVQLIKDDQELQEVVVTGHGAFDNQEKGYAEAIPVTGWTDFRAYLEEKLFYPEEAIEKGVEGRVVLQLTVSRLGKITEIVVKKSLGEGCDEEAIRLVKEGPKWKAASQDGHSVETKLRVKVKFELEE